MRVAIAVMGTLDTKGPEHEFVADLLRGYGHEVLLIDVGTGDAPTVRADIGRGEVLGGEMAFGGRGEAVTEMSRAVPVFLRRLHKEGRIAGVISLGGGGGTAICTAGMRVLPLGFPKLMVSTLASGNTAEYVGTSDIVMMPAVADIAGLNRISRVILRRAAGAVHGMVSAEMEVGEGRPLVVASMFGNTTACVMEARKILEEEGYEVLIFAATGTGGRAMEEVILSGMASGVLDLTTTELADELVGGVLSAGPTRMDAAAKMGMPVVIAPGCLDMVNFGMPGSVPGRFSGRKFYEHNPQVTLMRTDGEECAELGRIIAEKANACGKRCAILLPLGGLSMIGRRGGEFDDEDADGRLFDAVRRHARCETIEMDGEINGEEFARACAEKLICLMRENGA